MNTLESIRDFTEFYLLPFQPIKNIELVQYRVHRKIKGIEDPLLLTVSAFKETLSLLRKFKKHHPEKKPSPASQEDFHFYSELIHLSPEDCLIMIAPDRYQLEDSILALVFKRSESSVQFRRSQLLHYFTSEKVKMKNPKALSIETLMSSKTNSTLQPRPPHRDLLQKFQALPFALRFSIETLFVLSTLVLLMWIIPEIRNTYENSIQKRINDYLIESSLVDSPAPAGTSKIPKNPIADTPSKTEPEEADTSEPENVVRKQPKVNDGETWRFSFTGSQTNDIEAGIQETLRKKGIESNKPLTVPGGIQFDFLISTSSLIPLKESLEDMSTELQRRSGVSKQAGTSSSVNLSWYKKRNMGTRKIPSAHVQVIIWISTL